MIYLTPSLSLSLSHTHTHTLTRAHTQCIHDKLYGCASVDEEAKPASHSRKFGVGRGGGGGAPFWGGGGSGGLRRIPRNRPGRTGPTGRANGMVPVVDHKKKYLGNRKGGGGGGGKGGRERERE